MSTPAVGQRLSYDGALCTVRYVGEVARTSGGLWLGVEWDDPTRGKHDGVHKGVRYFTCRLRSRRALGPGAAQAQPPPLTPASFVRPTRPADPPRTFLEAVRAKYASEATTDGSGTPAVAASTRPGRQIIISGKVAEEVGFDKVRRQLAQIETLRVVILDGMCVLLAGDSGDDTSVQSIRATCPSITELDLSRNLFTQFATVADICRELPGLRGLRVNGNRLQISSESFLGAFDGVRELGAEETFLSWDEIGQMTTSFPALASLSAGSNQLSLLSPLPAASSLSTTLTTLNLEFNDFTALSDLASLTELRALRNLHLKGCSISRVVSDSDSSSSESTPSFAFSTSLHYLDLSYNRVTSWAFVDALTDVFPGLTSLRFAHNPIYNNPNLDNEATAAATTSSSSNSASASNATASTEESYMVAVGRLAHLRTLNFSTITPTDRANAEMFYLSRIAKQMAAVAEGAPEAAVVARHRRYAELCALYGEPAIVRHAEINPAFLEARLVSVLFCLEAKGGSAAAATQKAAQIPKSFDMYAVKGIAGRLFGRSPQQLRLVWETGEWDPVAGVDEEEEEDEDEKEEEAVARHEAESAQGNPASTEDAVDESGAGPQTGRWVKREVELRDSPRQFGFCVDGMEARIRVEVR